MILSGDVSQITPAIMVGHVYEWSKIEPAIPRWSLDSVTRSLLREKFLGCQRVFSVFDDIGERSVGHIVARISPTLKCLQGKPVGMLGFFAGLNQPEPIGRLLNFAGQWLREHGAGSVIGPIDGDTWHSYRINLGPFEEPAFLMEPTNPPWYESLWTSARFTPVDRFHSKVIHDVPAAAEATCAALQAARDHGYRFRTLDKSRFEDELKTIYRISCQSFVDNFLYDEISESVFLELYRPSQNIVDPRLVLFAEDSVGEPVGFLFNVVDYQRAVQSMRGGKGLGAKVRFMLNKKHANAVNFKSIGILPEHRRKSLAAALMNLGYKATIEMGYRRANLCLIRDGNASSSLDGGQGKILRRYALYQSDRSPLKPL